MQSLGRLLTGSIATAVLERATCPVAVVPESRTRSGGPSGDP
jgi:nucleotide-binding universal stress UspA family protein